MIRGLSELHLRNLKMELVERLGGAVRWKTTPLHLYANPQALKSTPSSRISMMMNWKRITKVFRDIHQQARQKYASRMFLHWWLGPIFQKIDFPTSEEVFGWEALYIVKHVTSLLLENSVLVWPVKTFAGELFTLPKIGLVDYMIPKLTTSENMFHLGWVQKNDKESPPSFRWISSIVTGKNTGIIKVPIAEGRHQMYTKVW